MTATSTPKPGFSAHLDMLTIPGFASGLHYPSLRLMLEATATFKAEMLQQLNDRLIDNLHLQDSFPRQGDDAANPFLFFVHALHLLQQAANLPVHERGRVLTTQAGQTAVVAIPTLSASMHGLKSAISWLAGLMNATLLGQDASPWLSRLPELLARLGQNSPKQTNINLLLKTALSMNIPFIELSGSTFQFGHGAQSRWLLSSFTDETSVISTSLARNKQEAAGLMRRCGIPVPDHFKVQTLEAALKAAEQLGFPVVVKPANLDGGTGVSAGLMTLEEVSAAYRIAEKLSNQILVEKHIDGRDYRLVVMHDELIWAIERVPGGVTGDGVSSIAVLLENSNLQRAQANQKTLKHIELDDEAQACLRRAGLTSADIPAQGQFVRLRSTANIGTGGIPVSVMPTVHPDNRDLAIRAARALRLDIAGIDLLMPDIAQSWKRIGGAICEINAQPQLGSLTSSHLYGQILGTLVKGQGRVPIVVVMGLPAADIGNIADRIRASPQLRDIRIGILEAGALFNTGQSMLLDKHIDAALYFVNEDSALKTGLPFDQISTLIIAGGHDHLTCEPAALASQRWKSLLHVLMAVCRQQVFVLDTAGIKLTGKPAAGTQPAILNAARARLPALLVEALLASDQP